MVEIREQSLSHLSKDIEIKTLVNEGENPLMCFLSLCSFSSLRSDALTDALVELIKQQQTNTNELERLYREQDESHD